jgi:hypothetical protein
MKKLNTLIIVFFFVFTITLFGQDISSGRIYSAQGNDFVVLRDGKRILYNADRLNDEPITLVAGDVFQTGPQSSADIQFGENGPLLKIVDNSSIGFVGNGSGRSMLALNLFYGRIRVRNVQSESIVQVSTNNGLVEVTKGDTGIDYIVRNDLATVQSDASVSSPVLYVTNFEGETNVFPANDGSAVSTLPQLLVRQSETVSVEFVSSLSYVERNALRSTTADFWRTYDFAPLPDSSTAIATVPAVETPPVVTPVESPEESTITKNVEEIPYSLPPINEEYEALLKKKNNAFLASLIFFAGGLALGGVGMYYQYVGEVDPAYFCTLSGVLVSGVGVGTLIHGLTLKLE